MWILLTVSSAVFVSHVYAKGRPCVAYHLFARPKLPGAWNEPGSCQRPKLRAALICLNLIDIEISR